MILSQGQLSAALRVVSSRYRILDRQYWQPTRDELENFLKKSFIDRYPYVREAYDCDDFAITLWAFAKQERHKQINRRQIPANQWFQWPLGVCLGQKPGAGHAFNICQTRDAGLVYIEPQTDRVVSATRYNIYDIWI